MRIHQIVGLTSKQKSDSFFEDMKKKLTEIDVWCKEFAKAKKNQLGI